MLPVNTIQNRCVLLLEGIALLRDGALFLSLFIWFFILFLPVVFLLFFHHSPFICRMYDTVVSICMQITCASSSSWFIDWSLRLFALSLAYKVALNGRYWNATGKRYLKGEGMLLCSIKSWWDYSNFQTVTLCTHFTSLRYHKFIHNRISVSV